MDNGALLAGLDIFQHVMESTADNLHKVFRYIRLSQFNENTCIGKPHVVELINQEVMNFQVL